MLLFVCCSRPTAVNLADSAIKLKAVAAQAASKPGATAELVTAAVVAAAEATLEEDIAANKVCHYTPHEDSFDCIH